MAFYFIHSKELLFIHSVEKVIWLTNCASDASCHIPLNFIMVFTVVTFLLETSGMNDCFINSGCSK